MSLPDLSRFEKLYDGIPAWEIGLPQPVLMEAAADITGSILDLGCGTGENANWFAARGHAVVGVDFVPAAIRQAREKSAGLPNAPQFLVHDGLAVHELGQQFDNVIDSGFFHVLSDEDRVRYEASVARVLKPGGRFFLICFRDDEPGTHGPRRVSEKELRDTFGRGWTILSIRKVQYKLRTDVPDSTYSPGGAKAWFLIARRAESE